jgi:transcription antitermination factor NusG
VFQPWFAIHVRPGREKFVASLLRAKGYTEFLPMYRSKFRWSDRIKERELALFPSYLFCRLDPDRRLPVLMTPWVNAIVGSGKRPEPIPESEVEAIRAIVQSGQRTLPWPFLQPGHRVTLEAGPLRGLEGVLMQMKKEYKLVVAVNLLQRAVAVEIDCRWAKPVSGNPLAVTAGMQGNIPIEYPPLPNFRC